MLMADDPKPEVISLRLPSRLELLSVLDRVTLALCERMELDENTTSQFSMSVIEAGTNAVQHGNKMDPSKFFDAQFSLYPDRLEVCIRDQGAGFDPAKLTDDVTSPEHLFDMRGRGIFIMKSCCDGVDFRFGPGGTTCLLVKHRPPVESRAADA
jgi:serine/threonine-protein kinase RsbW